jgi:heat-inducible transcriptional repressor
MIDLTPRQIHILRAIIEEYIETADPVGSETLDRKFNLGVSPATIRNEMVYLTKQGYLNKTHSSAGRSPTPLALKLYVNELMKEKELSVADEVSAKEKVWDSRKELDPLLQQVVRALAERSHALGIAVAGPQRLFHAGYSNLLKMPEFYDINVMRTVLTLIEEIRLLEEIFEYGASESPIRVVYGQELGNRYLEPVGVIYMTFDVQNTPCRIGVIGSHRFDYPYIIPMMKYYRALITELLEKNDVDVS